MRAEIPGIKFSRSFFGRSGIRSVLACSGQLRTRKQQRNKECEIDCERKAFDAKSVEEQHRDPLFEVNGNEVTHTKSESLQQFRTGAQRLHARELYRGLTGMQSVRSCSQSPRR